MKIGDTIAGRYELREPLGRGRAALFVAHDRRADRRVALKILAGAAPADLQRYAERLAAADRVLHPSVVLPRVQVATSESPPFVVGELLQGEDLEALCSRTRPLPWPRALAIVHACSEGLAALAAATGAAHCALRPGNVWLPPAGPAQVLDFAISELGAPPGRPRPDGSFAEYRAPEQLEGSPGDARSDVFSLGVLLLEALTGVHPFVGPTAAAVSIKLLMQPAPAPSRLAPQVELPGPLTALLARMLARRPKDRLPDPAALAHELAALLPAAPATVTPTEIAEQPLLEAAALSPSLEVAPPSPRPEVAAPSPRPEATPTPRPEAAAPPPPRPPGPPARRPAVASSRPPEVTAVLPPPRRPEPAAASRPEVTAVLPPPRRPEPEPPASGRTDISPTPRRPEVAPDPSEITEVSQPARRPEPIPASPELTEVARSPRRLEPIPDSPELTEVARPPRRPAPAPAPPELTEVTRLPRPPEPAPSEVTEVTQPPRRPEPAPEPPEVTEVTSHARRPGTTPASVTTSSDDLDDPISPGSTVRDSRRVLPTITGPERTLELAPDDDEATVVGRAPGAAIAQALHEATQILHPPDEDDAPTRTRLPRVADVGPADMMRSHKVLVHPPAAELHAVYAANRGRAASPELQRTRALLLVNVLLGLLLLAGVLWLLLRG